MQFCRHWLLLHAPSNAKYRCTKKQLGKRPAPQSWPVADFPTVEIWTFINHPGCQKRYVFRYISHFARDHGSAQPVTVARGSPRPGGKSCPAQWRSQHATSTAARNEIKNTLWTPWREFRDNLNSIGSNAKRKRSRCLVLRQPLLDALRICFTAVPRPRLVALPPPAPAPAGRASPAS